MSSDEVGNGERSLWCAVLQQALDDACAPIRFTAGTKPTFRSLETAKARAWLLRSNPGLSMVCHLADIERAAVQAYAQSAIGMGVIV